MSFFIIPFKLIDSWQKLVSQCNSLGIEKYCYCTHLCSVVRCRKWYISNVYIMSMQSFHLLLNHVQGKQSPFFGIFAVFFHALHLLTASTGRKPA